MGIFDWLHEKAVLNKKMRLQKVEQERLAALRMQENEMHIRAQENKRKRFGR